MTGKFTLPVLCLLAGLAHAEATANSRGRQLAANCTPCHAPDAPPTAIPSLVGRPRHEILKRLQAFEGGDTGSTIMHQIVRAYSDEELRAIADHLGTLAPTGR